jgi:hypothetical protein
MNTTLFRQFQYPTVPLSVSNDFKTKTLQAALRRVYGTTTTTGSQDEH